MTRGKTRRKYRPVPTYSTSDVMDAVSRKNLDILRTAAYAIPWHWKNWKAAQEHCLHFSHYQDTIVRANALRGLSYLARFQKHLDKKLVEPMLLRGLKDPRKLVREEAREAIEDINYLMKWRVGKKKRPE